MGGKIDCFIDVVSFYSRFGLERLLKDREALRAHGVDVEFHPIFLGGVNMASGNKPPWTLQAKADYLKFDTMRAQKYFGRENMGRPTVFPIVSLLPLRCMAYIKENFGDSKFEDTFMEIFSAYWDQDLDVSKPQDLGKVLARLFKEGEVKTILQAYSNPEIKKKILDNTDRAVKCGAFGAPWYWVRNGEGKEEPFFGSDRWAYMYEFIGLPWEDFKILPPSKL